MKHLYINSRLHPLLVALSLGVPRTWIFSLGEPWLFLTPGRLARLADRLSLADSRIGRLIRLVRRHAPDPRAYCRALGVKGGPQLTPDRYPLVLCASCGGVHYPHPEEALEACPDCREAAAARERKRADGAVRDRQRDQAARRAMLRKDPYSFDQGVLSPHWRINHSRRVHRDWDAAVNRILMGGAYRQVAREFECSVGLLHRKVRERRHWENN